MRTIWKYELELTDRQPIAMPGLANIVHAGLDPAGHICVWAEVDSEAEKADRWIAIIGTGNPFPKLEEQPRHLGSVTIPPFAWHVYEVTSA